MVSSWRKYRRIANEMLATILENSNMKKSELIVSFRKLSYFVWGKRRRSYDFDFKM